MNETSHVARPADAAVVARIAAELAELSRMTGAQMAEKYLALYGQPAHSRNKDFLRKRLAWRIQELAEGGLSERALARIEELGADALMASRRPTRHTESPQPPQWAWFQLTHLRAQVQSDRELPLVHRGRRRDA